MTTLWAATTRHCHTDNLSGEFPRGTPYNGLYWGGGGGGTAQKGTQASGI